MSLLALFSSPSSYWRVPPIVVHQVKRNPDIYPNEDSLMVVSSTLFDDAARPTFFGHKLPKWQGDGFHTREIVLKVLWNLGNLENRSKFVLVLVLF